MTLREDFGPGDSTELWTHFNEITAGINEIGQTARYWFRGGRGENPDKHVTEHYAGNANVAPDLNLAGAGLARSTTMAAPPVRVSGGRRLTFVDGGPHRIVWHPNWANTSRGGAVAAGIQLNANDAGQNLMGALTGTSLAERWENATPYALPGTPGVDAAGVTVEVSIDFDFDPGDSVLLWTRNETGGDLGLRFFELWTYATITRIGH